MQPRYPRTKKAVSESMQRFADYCEQHPVRPVAISGHAPTDEAKETAAQLNEIQRRANQLRIQRYKDFGIISSVGAW